LNKINQIHFLSAQKYTPSRTEEKRPMVSRVLSCNPLGSGNF
jgi:hypothetical protein